MSKTTRACGAWLNVFSLIDFILCIMFYTFLFTQVKLFSFFGEEMGYQTPTKDECSQELKKLKEDMISVHKYSSQGTHVPSVADSLYLIYNK